MEHITGVFDSDFRQGRIRFEIRVHEPLKCLKYAKTTQGLFSHFFTRHLLVLFHVADLSVWLV